MKHLVLQYEPFAGQNIQWYARHHKDILEEGATLLTGDVTVQVDGKPVLLRSDSQDSRTDALLDMLFDAANRYKFPKNGIQRAYQGTGYPGKAFGAVPRKELHRRMGVSISQFTVNNRQFSGLMEHLVEEGWLALKGKCTELYAAMDKAPKSLECWRIRGTPFTTGVVNKTTEIPYHRDRENVPETGSLMWVVRKHCEGGYLHLPELNALVDCRHGTLLVFYGEIFWHGVTRITGRSRVGANRYSVVAFSRNRILQGLEPEEERKLAAIRGTEAFDHRRSTYVK